MVSASAHHLAPLPLPPHCGGLARHSAWPRQALAPWFLQHGLVLVAGCFAQCAAHRPGTQQACAPCHSKATQRVAIRPTVPCLFESNTPASSTQRLQTARSACSTLKSVQQVHHGVTRRLLCRPRAAVLTHKQPPRQRLQAAGAASVDVAGPAAPAPLSELPEPTGEWSLLPWAETSEFARDHFAWAHKRCGHLVGGPF